MSKGKLNKNLMDLKILAIIPARAGSKGLPGKNLKELGGRPLIAWTIEAVKKSRYRLDMCFTTEDKEIASVAKGFGANVPFLRPEELAGDESSSLSVLLHALGEMERSSKIRYDFVIYLQPTSPFRDADVIDRAIELLVSNKEANSVVGVTPVGDSHPYWDLRIDEKGFLDYFVKLDFPRPLRRQDLPAAYHFNGAIVATRRGYFDKAKDPMPVFCEPMLPVVMSWIESINIDTEEDFLLAQAIVELRNQGSWVR